jgi:replication factor A1
MIVGIFQERVRLAAEQPAFSRDFLAIEGGNLNRKKYTIMDQLAFLSIKQGIYPAELHKAMLIAREKGKTTCQNLTIEYRGSIKDAAIFLFTKDTKVVVQFRVAEELLRKDICFENISYGRNMKQMNSQISPKLSMMVQDLRHGMKKVNIEAKVLETTKPSIVQTRFGNSAKVTNAWIADGTGKIKLCLWNEQADLITVGDTVQIKNASVFTFRGERQVRLGKTAIVNVVQNQLTA